MKTIVLWLLLAATCLAGYGGGSPPPPAHQPLVILHQEVCGNWCYVAITGGTRPYQARLYAAATGGEISWWETDQSGFFFSALPPGGYAFVIADKPCLRIHLGRAGTAYWPVIDGSAS